VFLEVLQLHKESLRHLSLAKNEVNNEFIKFLCDGLKDGSHIDFLDLTHLKKAKNISWVNYLKSISLLSEKK
jgi:hypothetical protein